MYKKNGALVCTHTNQGDFIHKYEKPLDMAKWGGNNLRNTGRRKNSKVKEVVLTHIKNNLKEYSIATLLLLIGLIFGIIFVNNASEMQVQDITGYLSEFVNSLKNNAQIDEGALLKDSLISNFLLVIALWFVGSTVIGIPIVYGIILYRGFCLGYTISSAIATLGIGKRNAVCCNFDFTTKYHFYSMYSSISRKWHEII